MNLFYIQDKQPLSRKGYFLLVLFALVVVFPVYWQLTGIPIRQWDESRLAVNAAEMLDNGNWIVTYFGGNPDLWNTKPPLQIWLIALSIKLFGYTEFAVRFPTTLAVLATFWVIFIFSFRQFKSALIAVLSVLVLVTSQGYMGYHVARNGDYDALLVLFTTIYSLAFFVFLENGKAKYLILVIAAVTLATLTKGVAGLMCLPGLFLYVLWQRKLLFLLKNKTFYLGIIAFLLAVLGYYFLRETYNPGYLKAVYENELGGRFLQTLEEHAHPWNWYFQLMFQEKYRIWLFVLPVLTLGLFLQKVTLYRRFALFGTLFILTFMLIISSAKTKLYWYDAPVYPIAAILIGIGFANILNFATNPSINGKLKYGVLATVVLLIFWNFKSLLKNYLAEKESSPAVLSETYYGPALKRIVQSDPSAKSILLLLTPNQYNASLLFYKMAYQKQGYIFNERYDESAIASLKPNELVVTCNDDFRIKIEKAFVVKRFYTNYSCGAFEILQQKDSSSAQTSVNEWID